ncbi:MAG: hypothetical protein IIC04_02715 [Proteobacteria bacterium]|nr:hypothetical protein [Pseudomonadota bacterium]
MTLDPAAGDGPNTVRVISSRLLGQWSQVRVGASDADGRDIQLDAECRAPSCPSPAEWSACRWTK